MDFGSWIQDIIATTNLPFLAAFLVGLLASIGPCPLATNVTALSYTAQQFTDRRAVVASSVLYTLGRAMARMPRNTPRRFTAITRSKSSTLPSSTELAAAIPAFRNAMLGGP